MYHEGAAIDFSHSMKETVRRFLLLSLSFIFLALPRADATLHAQTAAPEDELRVFLLTMGQGDEVWEKFGHNAIWVHDPVHGTDWVYNYGVFDFDSPGYWSRFVKGNWIYQLAVSDIYRTILAYQYMDRTVVAQELNLTPEQALELRDFLEWNSRPENVEYLYDYYRDNCSTRVRDVIDSVLGGALYRATAEVPSGTTYRWHSYRLVQGDILTRTGLALGLGPAADRPISQWEEMFLPGMLQERVRELEIPGPDGRLVPLVRSEQVLHEAVDRAAEAGAPAPALGGYLLAGLALGGLLFGLGWAAGKGGEGGRRALELGGRIGVALVGGGWALFSGVGGLLLTGLWAFTNHSIAHRNENLLQVNPLALGLVLLLPALALGARWASRPAHWGAVAVVCSSVLGFLLQVLPWFSQVNGDLIALALPANVGLLLAVRSLRRCRPSPPAGISSDLPEYRRSVSGGR